MTKWEAHIADEKTDLHVYPMTLWGKEVFVTAKYAQHVNLMVDIGEKAQQTRYFRSKKSTPIISLDRLISLKCFFSEYYDNFYKWMIAGGNETKTFVDTWEEGGKHPPRQFNILYTHNRREKSSDFIMDVVLLSDAKKIRVYRASIVVFSVGTIRCNDEYTNLHHLGG